MLEVHAFHISPSKSFKIVCAKSAVNSLSISFERVSESGFDRLEISDLVSLMDVLYRITVEKVLESCILNTSTDVSINVVDGTSNHKRLRFWKKFVDKMAKKANTDNSDKFSVVKTDVINSTIRIFIERVQECLSISQEVKN